MTVLLGTLWSSIKQIVAPYVFHWENAIALHAMQGNRASSHGKGEVSWVFSSCGRNLGYILELQRGGTFETAVCSVKSEHVSRYDGQLAKLNSALQDNMDASGGESGGQASLISWQSYTGNSINFYEESGNVTF